MTKKTTKAAPKTKTPRPQPATDATPTTSARFKKLIAGTAQEPTPPAEATPAETGADAPAAATPKAPRARQPKPVPAPTPAAELTAPLGATSLKTIGAAYIAHLQATGKSLSTIASYAADLECAYTHFGPAQDTAQLTPAEIEVFDTSDVVTKKKSGAARAKPTILKTRRVLRLALTWAAEAGTLAAAPYATKAAG